LSSRARYTSSIEEPSWKAAPADCWRQRLTSIAGSSAYFFGGVVSYSNELKTAWADVPAELIQTKAL